LSGSVWQKVFIAPAVGIMAFTEEPPMFCPACRKLLKHENGALKCNICGYTKDIPGSQGQNRPDRKTDPRIVCPKCNKKGTCIEVSKTVKAEDGLLTVDTVLSPIVYNCTACGFKFMENPRDIAVFEDLDTMPIDDQVFCSKCGNRGAYWHLRQTRSADEATTRFYRCTKCKNTWREYA